MCKLPCPHNSLIMTLGCLSRIVLDIVICLECKLETDFFHRDISYILKLNDFFFFFCLFVRID